MKLDEAGGQRRGALLAFCRFLVVDCICRLIKQCKLLVKDNGPACNLMKLVETVELNGILESRKLEEYERIAKNGSARPSCLSQLCKLKLGLSQNRQAFVTSQSKKVSLCLLRKSPKQ